MQAHADSDLKSWSIGGCSGKPAWGLFRASHFGHPPGASLTIRAEVAAAAGDHNAPDGSPAPWARLAGFLINAQSLKIISWPSFNINVVAKSGSLKINCTFEHFLDGPVKAARGIGRNVFRLGKRMDAGFKERLICINIPQSGNTLLVQEPALDRSAAPAPCAQELCFRRLLRVRPQAFEQRIEFFARAAAQSAKPADITET